MPRYRKLVFSMSMFLKPGSWLYAVRNPRMAFQAIRSVLRYPTLFIITRNVEGLIPWNLGVLLYQTVLTGKGTSPNVVEVGAFKGLSTVYLSRAARSAGKRVKSFELFSGLPSSDSLLDSRFRAGDFCSELGEYEANVEACGVRGVVDLLVGDARSTMLPTLGDAGFAVAFLDVDVYEVTRELLFQLWSVARGGEVIVVDDCDSPGVRKAIDEFHALSRNTAKETNFERGRVAKLDVQPLRPYVPDVPHESIDEALAVTPRRGLGSDG